MKGWYFSRESKRLRYGDERLIEVGTTHQVEGEPVLCEHGLHASKRLIDALRYAPGCTLWRVKLSKNVVRGDDKAVALKRRYLEEYDARPMLVEFTQWCAKRARKQADANDVNDADYAIYTAAAAYAAYAAYAAAADAADAADAAAYAAAATTAAAYAAAYDAAYDAERKKQNKRLVKLVRKLNQSTIEGEE